LFGKLYVVGAADSGGSSTSVSGYGVSGSSNSSYGVYGFSVDGNGVGGTSVNGYGVYGASSYGYAGYFDGNVGVNGYLDAFYYAPGGQMLIAAMAPDWLFVPPASVIRQMCSPLAVALNF
jgi:hypothetical protein